MNIRAGVGLDWVGWGVSSMGVGRWWVVEVGDRRMLFVVVVELVEEEDVVAVLWL